MARSRQRRQTQGQVQSLEFGPNLPCFRGWQDSESTTVVNLTETELKFDVWENGNDNVFSPNVSGGLLTSVDALIEGVFLINFNTKFTVTLATPTNVGLCVEEGGVTVDAPAVIHPAQPLAGDGAGGQYLYNMVRGYPPIWLHAGASTPGNAPSLATWTFQVAQDSGSDKHTSNANFEIYLIGGLSVDTSELV